MYSYFGEMFRGVLVNSGGRGMVLDVVLDSNRWSLGLECKWASPGFGIALLNEIPHLTEVWRVYCRWPMIGEQETRRLAIKHVRTRYWSKDYTTCRLQSSSQCPTLGEVGLKVEMDWELTQWALLESSDWCWVIVERGTGCKAHQSHPAITQL